MGHTQIPIRLPGGKLDPEGEAPVEKRTKKEAQPESWVNLELVCSRGGRLLHCRISRGSELDRGRSLRDKLRQQPQLMPPASCLVAGAGYPLTAQVLTPYTRRCGPKEELFNRTLEEHRQALDRTVAALKARFKRLACLDVGTYDRARAVVLTACVLHNVFVNLGREVHGASGTEGAPNEEEEVEEEDEGVHRREAVAERLMKNAESGS